MAFKTFTDGAVLTDVDLNDYLMKQTVIGCTSGSRPLSPAENWIIAESDTDLVLRYSGSAWETIADPAAWKAWSAYTPVWTAASSNPAIGNGTLSGRYLQIGKTVHYYGRILMGSTTTFGSGDWRISLPVTAQTVSGSGTAGAGTCGDASATSAGSRPVTMDLITSTTMRLVSPTGVVAGTVPFTWTTGDDVRWHITYEAA